ncbi:hypothetical protein ETN89_10025 [Photobacterium damselae subsp. damselae]|nr:hypothetical protein ETN89_10025 [Photobacterium damselae subsp. damselae]
MSRLIDSVSGGWILFATRHSPLATRHSPLATRHSPLATRHSPLATRHSPLATRSKVFPLPADKIKQNNDNNDLRAVRMEPVVVNLCQRG